MIPCQAPGQFSDNQNLLRSRGGFSVSPDISRPLGDWLQCSPPDMPRPLAPCQAPTRLPVHQDLWRFPGGLSVPFRNASVPRRAPSSLCSFPRHLPRTPPAPGSQLLGSRASACPQACAIAPDLSSLGLGTSTPPAVAGRPRPSQEVHANRGAGLTCSGARGSD